MAEAVYLSIVYDEDIPREMEWDLLRMRLFEDGHELSEIDSLGVRDIGLIVAYKSATQKGHEKMSERNKKLKPGATK